MKNKALFIIIGLLVLVTFLYTFKISFFKNNETLFFPGQRLNVVASFYPLAEFSRQIGKEKVNVTNLTPAGVEPHEFEPTPQDLATVQKSDVFIYNGAGFEPWVEKILPDIQKSGSVLINTSKRIELLAGNPAEEHENEEERIYDPHIWLDPVLASEQVDAIKDGLIEADPQNQMFYEANAEIYKQKFVQLDDQFQQSLAHCATRDVIASHGAFGYLARRYNLNITPISGLTPDEEPAPQKMADIVKFARNNDIKYIFFETLVNPRLSETIANEIGAQTLVFNPLEGLTNKELSEGKDYFAIQQENLDNLRVALNCNE